MLAAACVLLGLAGGAFANRVVRQLTGQAGVRRPVLEVAIGLAFGAVGARVGWNWALPGFLLFAWTLVVVAVIDGRTRRIPNRLTYPLIPALLGLLVVAALLNGQPGWAARALLGGVGAFGALFAVALVNPHGMGMGDVKLAAFIGVGLGYLGWDQLVVGMLGGFTLGGVAAMGLLATRLRGRKDLIPFGPYLAAGALLALLAGGRVLEVYARVTSLESLRGL
jgi:leader peptidase (prepilin peptidase)/N-methyltransferase